MNTNEDLVCPKCRTNNIDNCHLIICPVRKEEATNAMTPQFISFPKTARLSREVIITEKIDGTNAQLLITDDGQLFAGSRQRWITPDDDNYGFAQWAQDNRYELLKLGNGRHFGEWWGHGINRGYGLAKGDRRFSLFNVKRWSGVELPSCVSLVPVLYQGLFNTGVVDDVISDLRYGGSKAAPGFMRPEGVIVYHIAGDVAFKKTLERDGEAKFKK